VWSVVSWNPTAPGVLRLPSGRLLRGRAISQGLPAGPLPDFAVYLLDETPAAVDWDARWVRWPDFRLPRDPGDAWDALFEAWRRAEVERVEVACRGGRGRTGTALACIAVLDGVPAREAVALVRRHYDRHAVETPWQRRYVTHFPLERPVERVHGTPAGFLRALLAAVRGHR
jgi:protein-tyrosine phosphatase